MEADERTILLVLDRCCDSFTFPMLDNGYVYLAAVNMSLYRSSTDWAIAIEVFGYSPRSGLPDTQIYTFASRLANRKMPHDFVSKEAFERYLANNPHNESHFVFPIQEGPWLDPNDAELVSETVDHVIVRDESIKMPQLHDYEERGIMLEKSRRVQVFELCRYLAETSREQMLATPQERRNNIPPDLSEILQLEEWFHPDVVNDDRPSLCETFQQLAHVLNTGDPRAYRPTHKPNTHWRFWPEGGRL
jgi:hypothetical protein